jgi:type I restriction-modification system DNA methylase subunit
MFPSFAANIVALQTLTHTTLSSRNNDSDYSHLEAKPWSEIEKEREEAEIEMEVDGIINELEKEEQARINAMTVKSLKLQLERTQEENALLHQLVKELEAKITIFEDTLDKLKALNYIQEKYNK